MFCVVVTGRIERPSVVGPFFRVAEADAYADLRRAEELIYSDGTRVYVERLDVPTPADVALTTACAEVASMLCGGR